MSSFDVFDRTFRSVEPPSVPSSPAGPGGRRIQHLGLTAPTQLVPSRSVTLTSDRLRRRTVDRIRIVQIILGETPIPVGVGGEGDVDVEDEALQAWTVTTAIQRLTEETREIVSELIESV